MNQYEHDASQNPDDTLNIKIADYIKTMPSLPVTVTKVIEICDNPRTSPADLNHVISLDPVLVGRVLKLINSAYYGLSRPAASLVRAIIMLGINTVKNLALSTAVLRAFPVKGTGPGLNLEGFWRHSLCTAVTAKLLAKKRGIDNKQLEGYFTAGLLHDIGKIPLNAVLGREYRLATEAAEQAQISFYHEEDRRFALNHNAVGGTIVDAWRLEGAVADVIRCHHTWQDYEGPHKDVLYTTVLANRFAVSTGIGFAGDRYPDITVSPIWEALGLNQNIVEEFKPLVNQEIDRASIFLKL
ncbi:phosphohydrolase [Spirochaetia bacterium]|nr:phosphohydrolase [Spirochaetia bacterium]